MRLRLKALRVSLGLTQDEFANELGLQTRSKVVNFERGITEINDAFISLVCKQFKVNEEWLRYGTGEMFLPPVDEEAAYVAELLGDDENPLYDIIKAIMKTYSELGTKEQAVLKSFAKDLAEKTKEQ